MYIQGKATGGSATDTFGNLALNGHTAISADVHIHNNILIGNGSFGDSVDIIAQAYGGNEGPTGWDDPNLNTDANLANGSGPDGPSVAISARATIDNNLLIGGEGGASLQVIAQAQGGSIIGTFGLYANHAVNGGEATSALSIISDNALHGNGSALVTDTLIISGYATGGTAFDPGFSANVSGFAGYMDGKVISADVNISHNTMIEDGSANAFIELNAIAQGGSGKYFANYNYGSGTVISARVTVDDNHLTGGSADDYLNFNATATPGTGSNADVGAIGSELFITNNTLDGGSGNDILGFNTLDLLDPVNVNSLDGGSGINTLKFDKAGGTLDLTPVGISGGTVQNIEKVDLTNSGTNSVIVNESSVLNLNAAHTLYVTGVAGDSVNATAGGFVSQGSTVIGDGLLSDAGIVFDFYQSSGGADLYVQQGLTVI